MSKKIAAMTTMWTFVLIIVASTVQTTVSFQPHLNDALLMSNSFRCSKQNKQTHNDMVVSTKTRIRAIHERKQDDDIQEQTNEYEIFVDIQRRNVWTKTIVQIASAVVGVTALVSLTRPVFANSNQRSRTAGYTMQKSETEWKDMLSPMQYYVLREGGTERPGYSILEKEKRPGTFQCAGCGTPLFLSSDKFNSGTGWPSFARGLAGVETEKTNPFLSGLSGAELRCQTCGGHLGDVFNDGYLFIGTEAAVTGQRYCIDGAALNFYPNDDSNNQELPSSSLMVRGDTPAVSSLKSLSTLFDPPVVQPRD